PSGKPSQARVRRGDRHRRLAPGGTAADGQHPRLFWHRSSAARARTVVRPPSAISSTRPHTQYAPDAASRGLKGLVDRVRGSECQPHTVGCRPVTIAVLAEKPSVARDIAQVL